MSLTGGCWQETQLHVGSLIGHACRLLHYRQVSQCCAHSHVLGLTEQQYIKTVNPSLDSQHDNVTSSTSSKCTQGFIRCCHSFPHKRTPDFISCCCSSPSKHTPDFIPCCCSSPHCNLPHCCSSYCSDCNSPEPLQNLMAYYKVSR
jgi:hypothetical protein